MYYPGNQDNHILSWSRGILHPGVLGVTHDMLGPVKQPAHERLDPRPQLLLAVGQAGLMHVPLQVVVQVLARIQLRGAARQVKHLDPARAPPATAPPPRRRGH